MINKYCNKFYRKNKSFHKFYRPAVSQENMKPKHTTHRHTNSVIAGLFHRPDHFSSLQFCKRFRKALSQEYRQQGGDSCGSMRNSSGPDDAWTPGSWFTQRRDMADKSSSCIFKYSNLLPFLATQGLLTTRWRPLYALWGHFFLHFRYNWLIMAVNDAAVGATSYRSA